MNPPSNSYALSQNFMATRQQQQEAPSLNLSGPPSKPLIPGTADGKDGILPNELDKSVSDTNEFQEILDIIYDTKPINIAYGKDRRTQITPAALTGKKDLIYEHEIPSLVKKHSEDGYKEMQEFNFKQAMINFKKAENIINTYMSNNGKLHQDYIVHTFVNLGICLYKFGFLEESLALFEKSILILKSPLKSKPLHFTANATFNGSNNSEYFSDLANKIKYKKIKCSLHMQCCLILSEAEKHEEALIHSKLAIRLAFKLIIDSICICYHMFIHNKKNSESNENGTKVLSNTTLNNNRASFKIKTKEKKTRNKPMEVKSETSLKENIDEENANNDEVHIQQPISFKQIEDKNFPANLNDIYNNDYIVKLLPILYEVLKRTQDVQKDLISDKKDFIINVLKKACGEGFSLEEPNIKVILDSIDPYLHRLYRCNILSLIQMQPLNFIELAQTPEINEEIYPENIINKIANLALSFYCASTEMRFMEEKDYDIKRVNSILEMDSEYWLGRSLEISYVFLPNDMPFVIQIISVFCRLHLATKQIIPEDEPINDCYKLVLPIKGGLKASFFIPLVKIKSTLNKEVSKNGNSNEPNSINNLKKQNANNLKLFLKNSQTNAGLQTNALFPKKLSNSLGEKKQESLTNLEKIYLTRMNVPKNPHFPQNYKPNEENAVKKSTAKALEESTNNKKNSFVFKLKSKMKRSNTPNSLAIGDFNPSKSYKNVYNNSKKTMKRSASSSNKKKSSETTMKKNNNFLIASREGNINNIDLKNIQNVGIQINNNINVIINSNNNNNADGINLNLIKPLTNELSNSNLLNTKITLNDKKLKNTNVFMGKSKTKFNKINEVMTALTNERKNLNKEEKLIIFPTDYLKTININKKNDMTKIRENNFLMKDALTKSQNNLDSKS